MRISLGSLSWFALLGATQGFCFSTKSVTTVPTTASTRWRSRGLTAAGADIEQPTQPMPPSEEVSIPNRGKVNEIDFCIAPADVSLSRSYMSANANGNAAPPNTSTTSTKSLSLTRALNNASNRAVRRILLARSWPSAEALNLSLRQVLAAEKAGKPDIPMEDPSSSSATPSTSTTSSSDASGAKCPVPRPILNILMRRRDDPQNTVELGDTNNIVTAPKPRSRTDQEYVADQVQAFQERYGNLPGFNLAEAYLECILSLATSGLESPRSREVMESGVYDESYRRVVAVLKSVGTVFQPVPGTNQMGIAPKLVDQDICLSMLDKMSMKREKNGETPKKDAMSKEPKQPQPSAKPASVESGIGIARDEDDNKFRLQFWRKTEDGEQKLDVQSVNITDSEGDKSEDQDEFKLSPNDLGGVLLSAEEPSMTRQLNALSNIVQRALLFGGDQELLVLSETLDADKPAFVQRWYPGPDGEVHLMSLDEETRPGVQYLNCLVQLLKECYRNGVVTTLDPPLPLIQSYGNAYERLTASLVERGSGYIKPVANVKMMPVPRTAKEELGRFAMWESSFRQSTPDISSYPEDLEGSWEVRDEIGGETIGMTTVIFRPQGQVEVAPPMQGLRWRLDPGPAHLDTCTFQVLSDDGSILQYRGFIDRGARLEARFSKRSIRIRGSVMFQMRDGDNALMGDDYWKDMLPINYKTGTTKFVMTKVIEEKS